ncbi:hypothetical protein [Burkholderia sp. BCC1999]|uniref:hypothetical protein n=1 Tax=Burkholderia sp. BCC1999 TaxID=2817448 RepID=UPI002AC360BB|nr:hypothetical protein [Burkholderia sp. BCC1999]
MCRSSSTDCQPIVNQPSGRVLRRRRRRYAIRAGALHGTRAVQRFSLPVQGCLDSVSLETESGTRSPYRAITWRDAPAGIDYRWEYVAHDGATHRVYRFVNGTFVEVESSR